MGRSTGKRRPLAVAALLWAVASGAGAEQRFSLQLTGAYTELDGLVPIESLLTVQRLSNPFDPANPFTETTLPVQGELPFASEGGTWEVIAGWRFARHFQLQVGYADFGDFSSEKLFVPLSLTPIVVGPPAFGTIRDPGAFELVRSPGLLVNFPPFPNPPSLSPLPMTLVNLDPSAVTVGLRVDHPVVGRLRVYGRLGYLRAMFNAHDTAGTTFEVKDPGDENGWYWGAGVQYPLLERVLIGGGFAQYDLNLQTLDSYQLSLELLLF